MADEGIPLEEFLRRRAGVSDTPMRTAVDATMGALRTGSNAITGAATTGVAGLVEGLGALGGTEMGAGMQRPASTGPMISEDAQGVAQKIVPQTAMELGSAAGAALTPGGPLMRILGATVGGGAGSTIEGNSPITGALFGGLTTLLGEGVGYGAGKILRSRIGGREAIAGSELDKVAQEVSTYVPGLTGLKDAGEFKRAVKSRGPDSPYRQMTDEYLGKIGEVDTLIGGNKITVPTLDPQPMTIQQAVDKLKELGHAGFGGGKDIPANRTVAGQSDRAAWEQAMTEIKGELNRFNPTGQADQAFTEARRRWAVGNAYLKLLGDENAFKGLPNYVELNLNTVRQGYERRYSKFEAQLLPDERQALEGTLYRGGPFGSRDLLPSGSTSPLAGVSQIARHGGGSASVPMAAARIALPNLGAEYTGAAPYAINPLYQTGLDLAVQRGAAALPIQRR